MKLARKIILSRVPVKGFFRIENLLQITEIPNIEPKAPYLVAHHPILLEYNMEAFENQYPVEFPDNFPDFVRNSYEYGNCFYIILMLINIFTRYRFFVYDSNQFWAVEIGNDDKESISNGSIWVQRDYFYKKTIEFSENKFSHFTEQSICLIPAKEYFKKYGPILWDREVVLPITLGQMIQRYQSLPKTTKIKFLNSCILFNKSFDVFSISTSLFLIGIISAIENLMPTIEGKPCKTCNQPIYSVSSRFKKFFNKYTGGENYKWADRLYNARSGITHNGGLLLADIIPLNPYFDDKIERGQLLIAVRILLINWLITKTSDLKKT